MYQTQKGGEIVNPSKVKSKKDPRLLPPLHYLCKGLVTTFVKLVECYRRSPSVRWPACCSRVIVQCDYPFISGELDPLTVSSQIEAWRDPSQSVRCWQEGNIEIICSALPCPLRLRVQSLCGTRKLQCWPLYLKIQLEIKKNQQMFLIFRHQFRVLHLRLCLFPHSGRGRSWSFVPTLRCCWLAVSQTYALTCTH